jgi:aminomethyltransferase
MAKHTPLYDWHVARRARMVEFAGWDMPLYYSTILDEHNAVRTAAGLFDTSHMARFVVTGAEREAFLDALLPLDLKALALGTVGYSFFCNRQGGVLDDVTVYKAEDHLMVVANAANRDKIAAWLQGHRDGFNATVEDASDRLAMIAFQGPKAEAILQGLVDGDLSAIPYYHFAVLPVAGARTVVSRTGYTGEDGFELYCGAGYARATWEALMTAAEPEGAKPAGLGARDLLRLEAAMPLYGHELTEEITPIQAGLKRFVHLDKSEFIGREALAAAVAAGPPDRRLAGFRMLDNSIPRAESRLMSDGVSVGTVTSGAFSPALEKGIGMAYVDTSHATPGTRIEVEIRGKPHPAEIVKRPFYRRPK